VRIPHPTCLHVGLAVVCLVATGAGQTRYEDFFGEAEPPHVLQGSSPAVEDAVSTLRLLRDPEAPPIPELAKDLELDRTDVLDLLFDCLERRDVPSLPDAADDTPQILSIYQEELILEAFRRAGREAVHSSIERHTSPEHRPGRAAVVAARGAVDGSFDLGDLFALALPEDAEQPAPDVEQALTKAVVSIAGRHEDALPALSMLVHRLPPGLLPALVEAVGETRDPRGAEVLGQALLQREDLAAQVAAQVRLVGPSRHLAVNGELCALLRPHLEDENSGLQRATILALGALEDYPCLPRLIDFLESDDVGLQRNALWALREITDLRFGEQASRWRDWYEAEAEWGGIGRQRERLRLQSSNPAHAADAIREYARHRLNRHSLAEELESVLSRRETPLRIAACQALAELGSVYSMPSLVELMRDPRRALKDAAWEALKRISGEDLPMDPGVWEVRIHSGT